MYKLLCILIFSFFASTSLNAASGPLDLLKDIAATDSFSLPAPGMNGEVTDAERSQNLAALRIGIRDLMEQKTRTDISPLVSKSRKLTDLLSRSGANLSGSQYAEVMRQIEGAIDLVEHVGSGNPSGCYSTAYQSLNQAQSLELCSGGGTVETAACFRKAYQSLNTEQSIRLCKKGGVSETADCFRTASQSLNTEQSILLCSERGTLETPQCFRLAYQLLNTDPAMNLCLKGGTPERVNCFRTAYQSLNTEDALKVCGPQ